ncbi:MAG: hypothetical protein GOMPHAMPRED_003209 [Gomphillus americanus]|uniref:DUF1765-domain-containing protein n=1 Tax=Gomphillus americanus TaxID=1940652 RepID=A0A8H3I9P1_9LECA|nr:MAG: hypothetical protein GOMPHAMPRED_003209 [Gomphillus americanus]
MGKGGGTEVEKNWKDMSWIGGSRHKHMSALDTITKTHVNAVDMNLATQSQEKQPVGAATTTVQTEAEEDGVKEIQPSLIRSSSWKKRSSRLSFKKFSISELADPTLVEPPKALVNQESTSWRSKSTSSLSNLAKRGSRIIRTSSPSTGHSRTPSTSITKPEKAVTTKTEATSAKILEPSSTVQSFHTSQRPAMPKADRPTSSFFNRSASSPQLSSNLKKPRSTEPLSIATADPPTTIPALPTLTRLQQFQSAPPELLRKKDELWNTFRALDQDHAKFNNKPSSFKIGVIKSSLLPFLRRYVDHPSNRNLRIEDLDRRINVLNKWWTGLLAMTSGREGYAIAPSDRPMILDALTGIMQRPEWKQVMTSGRQNKSKASSSSSLSASGSEFLADTVLNNARGMFTQNLLSQMNFAVDRLSLRTVAASVVAFCGKAIAYAFFYCPGVADILLGLWNVPQTTIRRVLDEVGILRNINTKDTAESIAHLFPSNLQHLCLKTVPTLMRTLRERSLTRKNLEFINWDGPWIGRWSGRDSDLCFSFTKHYLHLVCKILGEDATDRERICAPGAVFVYGQLLSIMDATISVHKNPSAPSQAVTFDDILGADVSATTIATRAPNTARLMAENRLIMLLREILSENYPAAPALKISFAAMFGNLLKAATKRTSVTDGDACFILCDFLEESMFILARFFRNAEDPMAFLDWPFWLDVLKRLGDSNNTMTEVRLYAFIYSLWGYITRDDSKKRDLCQGWLLEDEYAYRQFNHWCPMVRAYYQRLLIWRIARCDGDASELDLEIYACLLSLLQKVFSQYLYKRSMADQEGDMIPSSTPATPAPGRRLLIIRDDSITIPTAMSPAFLASPTNNSTYQKLTSLENLDRFSVSSESIEKTAKKRFVFLRHLNSFLSTTASIYSSEPASPKDSPPSSTHTPGESTGTSTPESRTSRPNTPPTPVPEYIPSRSFKFSLEWVDRAYPYRLDRKLYPPRLPPPAQMVLPKELTEAILLGDTVPSTKEEPASRYIGIALAEWSILVSECASFTERRQREGVPAGRVETPMLGVETFRKPIG